MKKSFLCSLILTICIPNCFSMKLKTIQVQNNTGKIFNVSPVQTMNDFNAIPKELGIDYRITKEDTKKSCSLFKGIDLDTQRTRSQVLTIKDGSNVIGFATIIVTPFKLFSELGVLQKHNDTLIFKSISEVLSLTDENAFIINLGFFHILTKYRNKNLASAVLTHVVIPTMADLVQTTYKNKKLIITCAPDGLLSKKKFTEIRNTWTKYLSGKTTIKVPLPNNFATILGKVTSQATFSSIKAQTFGLELLPVYSFSLGPIFIQKLF